MNMEAMHEIETRFGAIRPQTATPRAISHRTFDNRTFHLFAGPFLIVGALLLALALGGCAQTQTNETKPLEPAANLDPLEEVEVGNQDNDIQSDIWYKDGNREEGGFALGHAANDSGRAVDWYDESGEETARNGWDNVVEDKHLKSAEGIEPAYDLVFHDTMRAYDYASETWYIRGDEAAIKTLFAKRTFRNPTSGSTVTFNEDGTVDGTDDGKEPWSGAWAVVGYNLVNVSSNDSPDIQWRAIVDGDGKVTAVQPLSFDRTPYELQR